MIAFRFFVTLLRRQDSNIAVRRCRCGPTEDHEERKIIIVLSFILTTPDRSKTAILGVAMRVGRLGAFSQHAHHCRVYFLVPKFVVIHTLRLAWLCS